MDTNSLHLTFVYVSAILNCVSAIRSGTDQLSTLRITFKAPRVLVALKGFAIVRNTRQAKHGSTTTGQAKHPRYESDENKRNQMERQYMRSMQKKMTEWYKRTKLLALCLAFRKGQFWNATEIDFAYG
ncbi:uncharacterized protein LOC141891971 isoform X2 [Acropora palmata]|uniref:uncharacterized protein LOC141891971 isoform X2 n=1 Tax=Acropora palmata TaxID=6131 RepID=UPI003DA1BE53